MRSSTHTSGVVSRILLAYAFVCMFAATTAWASFGQQGRSQQGHSQQGHSQQSTIISSGLSGDVFIAELADGRPVELLDFHGDSADAIVWDLTTEESTAMTLTAGQLVGMTWQAPVCSNALCIGTTYRITSVVQDSVPNTMPDYSDNSDISLFHVQYLQDDDNGVWQEVCNIADDLSNNPTNRGIFVSGTWNEDGEWNELGYTFSCSSGVISKCTRSWGYKPWLSLPDDNGQPVDLQPLHEACTRLARADYCGDGIHHTLNGLLIDVFDEQGFNVQEWMPGFFEEARFDEYGAVSMKHRRVPRFLLRGKHKRIPCRWYLPRNPPAGTEYLLHVWSPLPWTYLYVLAQGIPASQLWIEAYEYLVNTRHHQDRYPHADD